MSGAPIAVRKLSRHEEFHDAVRLQKEIWGFEDIELLPVRLFVVASRVGGQVFGAYEGERMAGFALAIPAIKHGHGSYLHSHMVGVSAAYRNRGVGRMLKLAQRGEALERGIELMEWTFDPLELKNAYFNIERLGAIVRRYVRNQYGTTTSTLHGGLPTDRCVAEWWVGSERVRGAVEKTGFARPAVRERIEVPADIAEIRGKDQARAREIQAGVSARFDAAFRERLAVIGFERGGERASYLLGEWA